MQDQEFSPELIGHLRGVCKHHPHPRVRQQVQAVLCEPPSRFPSFARRSPPA